MMIIDILSAGGCFLLLLSSGRCWSHSCSLTLGSGILLLSHFATVFPYFNQLKSVWVTHLRRNPWKCFSVLSINCVDGLALLSSTRLPADSCVRTENLEGFCCYPRLIDHFTSMAIIMEKKKQIVNRQINKIENGVACGRRTERVRVHRHYLRTWLPVDGGVASHWKQTDTQVEERQVNNQPMK